MGALLRTVRTLDYDNNVFRQMGKELAHRTAYRSTSGAYLDIELFNDDYRTQHTDILDFLRCVRLRLEATE